MATSIVTGHELLWIFSSVETEPDLGCFDEVGIEGVILLASV
jgi:hypothetical protein